MQKGIAQRAYMVTVLWTGSDRFCYTVSTSLHGLPPNFTHALKICLGRFLNPFWSARLIGSGGNSPSSRFSWHKVWTGVKWNFSSAQLHDRYVDGKLPISQVWIWNFTRIRRKTKKLWLSIIPARRPSEQPGLGPPQKGVNRNFSSSEFDKLYGVRKLSISDA